MKKIASFIFIFVVFFGVKAQYNQIVTNNVTISSDFDLGFVLDAHVDKNKNKTSEKGYRIQVINSTNREEAYNMKTAVYEHNSSIKSYIVYDQPYYKLRIGDFKTRLEAYQYLDEIIDAFQSAFVVRDDIKIK